MGREISRRCRNRVKKRGLQKVECQWGEWRGGAYWNTTDPKGLNHVTHSKPFDPPPTPHPPGYKILACALQNTWTIINSIVFIYFVGKYARIFVFEHYLFLEAYSFSRASLSENFEHQGTDNVRGQIPAHIFALNRGYCLFIVFLEGTVTNLAIWLVLYPISIFLSLPTGHGNAFVSRRVHPNFRCHFS